MTRWFVVRAAVAALLAGVCTGAVFAADLDVRPYLADPTLGARGGGGGFIERAPIYRAPVQTEPSYRAPEAGVPRARQRREYVMPAAPPPPAPPAAVFPIKPAPAAAPEVAAVPPVAVDVANERDAGFGPSPLLILVLLVLIGGCVLVAYASAPAAAGSTSFAAAAAGAAAGSSTRAARETSANADRRDYPMTKVNRGMPVPKQTGFPSQDGWARRAGTVRNPVSGFFFGVGARANARALDEEQKRMKSARAVIKEYSGMYADMLEGEENATAYGVRRDLAGEFYEHERATHEEVFDEAAHRRQLAEKRRAKEMTEADTRQIEAQHEQEAVVRFKEPKFAAGLARFEEKQKGYQVGAASADAAIAETKGPAVSEKGANDNAEVAALYALLQEKMRAIEEAERLGQDTQALREQVELYKKLLNLT